jgi:tetratricopeptide (TPR) repeat protein
MLGDAAFVRRDYPLATSLLEESLAVSRRHGLTSGTAVAAAFLGQCAHAQGDRERAETLYLESLDASRTAGDRMLEGWPLNRLGTLARLRGEYVRARDLHEAALERYREIGSSGMAAGSLVYLGKAACDQGDYDAARQYFESALEDWRRTGSEGGVAGALVDLGALACAQGDYPAAEPLLQEGLHRKPRTRNDPEEDSLWAACVQLGLAECSRARGDLAQAMSWIVEGLDEARHSSNKAQVAALVEQLAHVGAALGSCEEAIRLLGAADGIRLAIGPVRPVGAGRQYAQLVDALRPAGSSEWFARVHAEAAGMSVEESIAWAVATVHNWRTAAAEYSATMTTPAAAGELPPSIVALMGPLTRRERRRRQPS